MIFISYRREDSAGHAGRLFDRVCIRYGDGNVFMDHHDLAPGRDFAKEIAAHLSRATAVLAVIGPCWTSASDADGKQRLAQPEDFVRRELQQALSERKALVPVLVGGAALPLAHEIPAQLAPLLRLQACELRDSRFDADLQALLDSLPTTPQSHASPAHTLAGRWTAQVRYPWQTSAQTERFDFEVDAGELFGTVTFLGAPRTLDDVELLSDGARFIVRSQAVSGEEQRTIEHRYRVRLEGEVLRVRMQSSGGFNDYPPLQFDARREK